MENMILSYYFVTCKTEEEIKENKEFFEMQEVIRDDFKRLWYLVSDCEKSVEQKLLLSEIENIIKDICCNRFENNPVIGLYISLQDNFLAFSYYRFDDQGNPSDTPSIVVLSRKIDKIYFIEELYSVFNETEDNCDYNRGHDEINYYEIKNNNITRYNLELEEYTCDLFERLFYETSLYISYIESLGNIVKTNEHKITQLHGPQFVKK